MNKKAISALIGWVLLLGFTITVAAFVTSWVIGQVGKFNPEDVVGGCNIYCEDVSMSIEGIVQTGTEGICNNGMPFLGTITLRNKGKFTIRELEGLGQQVNFDVVEIKPGQESDVEFFFCILSEDNSVEIIPIINVEDEGECSCTESSAVINDAIIQDIVPI